MFDSAQTGFAPFPKMEGMQASAPRPEQDPEWATMVPVYRFWYFDRALGKCALSDDYASEEAIRELRAEPDIASSMVVHVRQLCRAGLLSPSHTGKALRTN